MNYGNPYELRALKARLFLDHLGYYDALKGVQYNGSKGPLGKRKAKWGYIRLSQYMVKKYPEDYLVFKTKMRVTGRWKVVK